MKRNSMHSLEPASARKRIAAAKANKSLTAALLDRDHRGHKDAVEQWTQLHRAAFSESGSLGPAHSHGRSAEEPIGAPGLVQNRSLHTGKPGRRLRSRSPGSPRKSGHQRTGGLAQEQAPESESGQRPIINMEADRIQVLLNDVPAQFEIDDNPDADPNYGAWRASHTLGRNAVRRNDAIIEREANAQGVDADLVRAIMYVENAQGLDSQIAEATHILESESLLPMNIRPDPWAAIEDPPADLNDPATNVRIAVTLIRRIAERIDNPTPAKVASVWNFTGREMVNDFGERVHDAYDRRIWERPVLPTPDLDISP